MLDYLIIIQTGMKTVGLFLSRRSFCSSCDLLHLSKLIFLNMELDGKLVERVIEEEIENFLIFSITFVFLHISTVFFLHTKIMNINNPINKKKIIAFINIQIRKMEKCFNIHTLGGLLKFFRAESNVDV